MSHAGSFVQCFVDDRHEKGRRVTASRAFLPGRSEAFKGGGSTGLLTLRPNCTAAEIILELADGEYGATHQPQTGMV